ncbi:MAG: DUF1761 domain-containing protein [Fidelibacterota bacterium]|nr:MAG: DUF1761 domain-containing protein [Candidatus Neomarinimicrobiota bacterium]
MTQPDISLIAVLIASILGFGLGALWYSPKLFGKQWMAALDISTEGLQEEFSPARTYGTRFVTTLVAAYVLARILVHTEASTLVAGFETGFLVWLGFVATFALDGVLFEKRSFKLYLINSGYYLVSLMLMGALLGLWH